MRFGLQLMSPHPASENMPNRLQELRAQACLAQADGFHAFVVLQHYFPTPFQRLQPSALLARMAVEAQQVRLLAGIMLLSLQNPIALTRDQRLIKGLEQLRLCHQRLGVNHFLLRVQWAGMPQQQVLEAIALVGERIIPHLRAV